MFSIRLLVVSCAIALLYCLACQRDPIITNNNLTARQSPLDSAILKKLGLGINASINKNIALAEKIRIETNADNLPADSILAMFFHHLAGAYSRTSQYEKAIPIYHKAMNTWEKCYGDARRKDVSYTLYNLGNAYHLTYQFEKAYDYLQKTLQMQAKILTFDDSNLADTYREIGSILRDKNDYFHALEHLKKAENIYMLRPDTPFYFNWVRACNLIGTTSRQAHNYQQAVLFYKKAIDIALKPESIRGILSLPIDNQLNAGHIFNNLGNVLRDSGDYTAAIAAFHRSLTLQTTQQEDTYLDMARTFWLMKQPNDAALHLAKAKIICQQKNAPIEAASIENLAAEMTIADNKVDSALKSTNLALQFLLPKYAANTPLSTEALETALSREILIETLDLRAKAFAKQYENTKNETDLAASLATYTTADALITAMLNDLSHDESRYFWTEKVNGIYEKAIGTALRLYNQTKKIDYQNAALTFATNGKAFTLRNTLKNNRALQFADMPKEVLSKEQTLKASLAFWQKEYSQYRDSSSIATAFLEAKRQFLDFQKQMETQFPNYYRLKYAPNPPLSMSSLQKQLSADMLAVEYFLGDSSLFVFGASPTQTCIFEEKLTPDFLTKIQTLKQSISGNWVNDKSVSAEGAYLNTAHELYKILLEHPLSILNADGKHNRLRIVTDGVLGYIPFDVLIQKPNTNDTWRSADYLIKHYAISYALTNDHLNDPSVKTARVSNFNGFGISYTQDLGFNKQQKPNAPLPDAPTEIEKTYDKLGRNGKIWLENEANKANFSKIANNSDVLHFAMHGYIDEQNPLNSGLVLSPQNATDTTPNLTGFDLYAMNLDAKLAVLSACQTGDGVLKRHEGVMSLARSFTFAGCKSVVMSLWQIPDRSTADIMSNFYDHLKKGLPKDLALQQAKLDFLQNSPPSQRIPEKWAACVVIGDPVALSWQMTWVWKWVGIALLGALGGWFYFRNLRKTKLKTT